MFEIDIFAFSFYFFIVKLRIHVTDTLNFGLIFVIEKLKFKKDGGGAKRVN